MQKRILTPEGCGNLIPHFPELNDEKLKRLNRISTRMSKFVQGQRIVVMDTPPILILEDQYILNGKHRAYWATLNRFNLEACIAVDGPDIIYHTPHCTYGETGLEGVLEAYKNQAIYISLCNKIGIYTISDFIH